MQKNINDKNCWFYLLKGFEPSYSSNFIHPYVFFFALNDELQFNGLKVTSYLKSHSWMLKITLYGRFLPLHKKEKVSHERKFMGMHVRETQYLCNNWIFQVFWQFFPSILIINILCVLLWETKGQVATSEWYFERIGGPHWVFKRFIVQTWRNWWI